MYRCLKQFSTRAVSGAVILALCAVTGCTPKEESTAPANDAAESGAAGSENAAATESAGGPVAIAGKVKFDGPRPVRPAIDPGSNADCKALHAESPLLSDVEIVDENGGVQWSFVYIKNAPKGDYPVPTEPAVLDQKGCHYTPHVLGMRAGQSLDTVNSDPFNHNVRSFTDRSLNRNWNYGQQGVGTRSRVVEKPEMAIKLKCDIHPWMLGHLFVMDHPFFAVTDETGGFTIPNVPAGTYTLVAWHEKYGEVEQEVTVAGGAISDVTFTFKPSV